MSVSRDVEYGQSGGFAILEVLWFGPMFLISGDEVRSVNRAADTPKDGRVTRQLVSSSFGLNRAL
jgi:hypothetical protein